MVQELPVEHKTAVDVYILTMFRKNDPLKILNFVSFINLLHEWLLSSLVSRLPTGCPTLCLGAEKPCRLLELFLNRRVMLVGKSREFGENNKKKVLVNLQSNRRSSGEEYIHLLESFRNLSNLLSRDVYWCTPHCPQWSVSATTVKDRQVFQLLAVLAVFQWLCVVISVRCSGSQSKL